GGRVLRGGPGRRGRVGGRRAGQQAQTEREQRGDAGADQQPGHEDLAEGAPLDEAHAPTFWSVGMLTVPTAPTAGATDEAVARAGTGPTRSPPASPVVAATGSSDAPFSSSHASLTLVWSTGLRREASRIAAEETTSSRKTARVPAVPPMDDSSQWHSAPTRPAAGRVTIQATNIRPATLHRTLAPGMPTPEPSTEPVATCVVESEKPKWLESRMTAADDVSAAMP